jgi:prepilin-type N-terminal cleavage/methylation domain-containing protein
MDRLLRSQRHGFTLVELMVVIALMLVLASLAVLFIPRVNSEQQATRAAGQLQQWFEMAKQRAARDRAPRGVRLLAGSANPTFVTDLVFLVQADDYYLGSVGVAPATILSRATISTSTKVSFDMVVQRTGAVSATTPPRTLTGGQANASLYPVQPGDHIVFDGGGPVYQIVNVGPSAGALGGGTLTTTPPFPATMLGHTTTQYVIIRQPRPDGDEGLQMPSNVVIDCKPKGIQGGIYDLQPTLSAAVPHYDIMFAPDGRVIGTFANQEILIFWVRDVTLDGNQGDPTLVVIYPRTGLIAAHPVDLSNYNGATNPPTYPNPYTFTKTGIRSSQ